MLATKGDQVANDVDEQKAVESTEASEEATPAAATDKDGELPETVTLRSYDGEEFVVSLAVGQKSVMIRNIVDDGCSNKGVPLPMVKGKVLAKVIEYWKKHAEAADDEDLKEWDKKFFEGFGKDMLFEVVLAADYLDSKDLLAVACQHVADLIKDMKVEDCRDYFSIENDFTPEEERAIREEHAWVHEV